MDFRFDQKINEKNGRILSAFVLSRREENRFTFVATLFDERTDGDDSICGTIERDWLRLDMREKRSMDDRATTNNSLSRASVQLIIIMKDRLPLRACNRDQSQQRGRRWENSNSTRIHHAVQTAVMSLDCNQVHLSQSPPFPPVLCHSRSSRIEYRKFVYQTDSTAKWHFPSIRLRVSESFGVLWEFHRWIE